jgi:hypothetical protein
MRIGFDAWPPKKVSSESACGKHPDDFSSPEVVAWLSKEVGLYNYASDFEAFAISGGTMRELQMQHLDAIVEHPLHQAKIIGEWKVLRSNREGCLKRAAERT